MISVQRCVFLLVEEGTTAVYISEAPAGILNVSVTGNIILSGQSVGPVREMAILWRRPTLRVWLRTVKLATMAYLSGRGSDDR